MLLAAAIIELMTELTKFAHDVYATMPEAQRNNFLVRHDERMQTLHGLLSRLRLPDVIGAPQDGPR